MSFATARRSRNRTRGFMVTMRDECFVMRATRDVGNKSI